MQSVGNALHLKELLNMPLLAHFHNQNHVQCVERLDPLRAVDEWIAGYGERFDVNKCWDRFVEHSPFYTYRSKYEPGPYFYGGINFRVFFEYRYYLAKGCVAPSDFEKSVVKELGKCYRTVAKDVKEAYAIFMKEFTVRSPDDAGEPDPLFLALWDIAKC